MSAEWLSDNAANRYNKTYMKGFLDISGGDVIVRNHNVYVRAGDVSINGDLLVNYDTSLNGKLFVRSDVSMDSILAVANDVSFNSKLFVNKDVSFNSKLSVGNDVSFNSKFTVANDVSFNNRFTVINDVSFGSKLNLGADASFNSKLRVGNDVSFNAKFTVTNDVSFNSRFTVINDASFGSKLNLGADASFNSKLSVGNDVSFNSRFTVSNDVSFNSRFTVINDASFGSKLNLGSDASFNSKLRVGNDASFNAKLTVANDVSFNSRFTVSDDVSFNSRFTVINDVSFGSKLNLGADASFNSKLRVGNDVSFNAKFTVANDVSFNSRFTVSNDVSFNGLFTVINDVSFGSKLNLGADASFNSKLRVGNDASFNAKLTVANDVSFNSRFTVSNDVSFNGLFTVINDVSFGSKLNLGADASFNSKLRVGNDVSFNAKLTVRNDVSFNSRFTVSDDVSFNSRFTVINDVSFGSKLNLGADASFNSKLGVGNDVSFNAKLTVRNDVSFNSRFTVSDDVSFNSRFTVINDASFGSKLNLGSDASFNSKLSVGNDVSFNSKFTVSNDVSFNKNLFVGGDVVIRGNMSVFQQTANSVINTTVNNYQIVNTLDISVNGNLVVSSDVSFNSKLFVKNDVSFNSKLFLSNASLYINSMPVNSNATELNYLNTATPGNAVPSKALVVDSNRSIGNISSITANIINVTKMIGDLDGAANQYKVTNVDGSSNTYKLPLSDTNINNASSSVYISSKLSFQPNNNLLTVGNITLSGKLVVGDDVSFNSRFTVINDASFGSKLNLGADASFNSKLSVGNDVSFNAKFTVRNDVSFNSRFTVSDDVSFNSRFTVINDASFGSKLNLGADASFNSKLSVGNDVSFNAKFTVRNDVSFNSRFTVSDDVSFNSRFTVINDVSFGSKLNLGADASFNSKLRVGNDVSFNAKLTVRNDVSFNSRVDICGNLYAQYPSASIPSSAIDLANDISINGLTIGCGTNDISTNSVLGYQALLSNTTGYNNSAFGFQTLRDNTTGQTNSAVGFQALRYNTVGIENTAIGDTAGFFNKTGTYNTFLGANADVDSSQNTWTSSTAIGANAKITASNQIMLGTSSATVTVPGSLLVATDSSMTIGTTNPVSIRQTTTSNEMNYNVPTSYFHRFKVNNGMQMELDATRLTLTEHLRVASSKRVEYNGSTTAYTSYVTDSLNNYVPTGNSFGWLVDNVQQAKLDATRLILVGDLRVSSDKRVQYSGTVSAYTSYVSASSRLNNYVPASNSFGWLVNSVQQAQIDTSGITIMNTTATPVQKLYLDTNKINFIDSNLSSLRYNCSLNNSHLFLANNVQIGSLNATGLTISTDNSILTIGTTNAVSIKHTTASNEMNYNVPSTYFHRFKVNNGMQMELDASRLTLAEHLRVASSKRVEYNGSTTAYTSYVTDSLNNYVPTGNSFGWLVDNVQQAKLDATRLILVGDLRVSSDKRVQYSGTVSAYTSYVSASSRLNNYVPASNSFGWLVNDVQQATLDATGLTLNAENSILTIGTTNPVSIRQTTASTEMNYNVPATWEHRFKINNATQLELDATLGATFTGAVRAPKLVISGDASFNGNVDISGVLSVTSTLNSIVKNTTINNYYVSVTNDLSLNGNLFVSKDVSLNSQLFVKTDLSVNGNIRVGNALVLPIGTSASAAAIGSVRYNTSTSAFEGYTNDWNTLGGGVTSINKKVRITADNSNALQFFTGTTVSAEVMRIDNSGNVGIGITNTENGTRYPAAALTISRPVTNPAGDSAVATNFAPTELLRLQVTDADIFTGLINQGIGNGVKMSFCGGTDVAYQYEMASISSIKLANDDNNSASGLVFCTHRPELYNASSPASIQTATERMRINENGNVGIGTTAPTSLLHVNGVITCAGINSSDTLFVSGINLTAYPSSNIAAVNITATTVTATTFTGLASNATNALNATNANNIYTDLATLNQNYYLLSATNITANNTLTYKSGNFYYNPSSGTLNSTSFNATSDYRIKDNVRPLTDCSFTIDHLRPVTYNNNQANNKQDIGLIAHEAQEHFPFLVTGEKDGEQNQSINYTGFIALLIHEIQQLKRRVSDLEYQANK